MESEQTSEKPWLLDAAYVVPSEKARSRRLQIFVRKFCYHVDMKIKLSAHGAYHHQYHVVWIPKYRKKVLKEELKQYLEKGLFDIETFHPDNELPRSKLRGINPPLAYSSGPPVWRGRVGVSCVDSSCEPQNNSNWTSWRCSCV
jgi:hypothetical protein